MSYFRRICDSEQSWLWVVLVAPWLLFPDQMPHTGVVVAAVITVPTVVSLLRGERVWPRTPFSTPCVLLAASVFMGFLMSSYPEVSRPKLAGVVLGMLTLRATLLSTRGRTRLAFAVGLYFMAGVGCVTMGLLGTYVTNKFWNGEITSLIPHAILHFAGAGTDGFVNQNALGATTLFFLPLAFALCRLKRPLADGVLRGSPRFTRLIVGFHRSHLVTVGMPLLALFLFLILLVSQSRTAWVSLAATLAVLAAARWRAARVLTVVSVVAVLAFFLYSRPSVDATSTYLRSALVKTSPVPETPYVPARTELWARALQCIQDSPFTGIGLGAFRRVVPVQYPFSAPPLWDIVHAHNTFLQTAVDVGLGGLVAYIALLVLATVMSWQVYRAGGALVRSLVLGVWCNVLAVHLFGLTDAVALGAKVGVFLWWNLGLIGSLHAQVTPAGRCGWHFG
jgi:putative inorganic carbon (HCO3(-)) transporter